MDNYVVRQAIKDVSNEILGYEILFQEEDGLRSEEDEHVAADTIVNFLTQNGKRMLDGKTAFITFSPKLLTRQIPKIFNENKIVIQVGGGVLSLPSAHETLMDFKERKYKIAINDFKFAPKYFAVLGIVDYIRLNFASAGGARISYANIIKTAKGFEKKCIAYKIDNKESYDLARKMGIDYLEGTYLEEKISEKAGKLDYVKSNFFMLVVEITKDEPDLSVIEEIVSRDVTLTYALFRLVNSAYFAMKNKVSSIRQALVVLGINGLKQWIYLLSFRQGDENLREDLIKTSFLRANFCSELLPYTSKIGVSKSEAYLMGMFSTLGLLVGMPPAEALSEVGLSDEIVEALLYREGPCGTLFNLVLSYEKADWLRINEYAEQLGIPKTRITQVYFDCIESVNFTWQAFTKSL